MLYTVCAHCSSTWQGIVYHQHDRPTDTCSNMHTNHAMYYDLLVAELLLPLTLPQVHDDIFPIRLAVLVPLEIGAES